MDAQHEMPRLALPFALVGASAGWLSTDLLDNPLVGVTPTHAEPFAALCSAVAGACAGAFLTRRCVPQEAFVPKGFMYVQVVLAVLIAGVVSGGIVGALAFANLEGTISGLLAGLGAGAAFLPACALVIAAARRAVRARLGSLVADADRREMWGLMATCLAVTTCASLPDWLVDQPPILPGMIAGLSLGAMVALAALDLAARRRVRTAAASSRSMELRDHEAVDPEDPPPDLDFGLGDELRARMARGASAYRAREETRALVLGSPDQAVQAVTRSLAMKTLGLAVAAAVVAAHCLGPAAPSLLPVHEAACALGAMPECRVAAAMIDEEGSPEGRFRAFDLAARACQAQARPDAQACRDVARRLDRDTGSAQSSTTALSFRDRACMIGDVGSCRILSDQLLRGVNGVRDPDRADNLLQIACYFGDKTSCDERHRAR